MTLSRKVSGALLKLALRARARQDILYIIQYGKSEHGETATRGYVGKLRERIDWLRRNPKLGSIYHEFANREIHGLVRSFRQGQQRIYYTADEHSLTVIRILHMRSDVERHLN
jgi:plasmid stabilization system protein ParE